MRTRRHGVGLGILVVALLGVPWTVRANLASDALRARATTEIYNLDDGQALATWREATVADPGDAAAWRGLAGAIVARIGMLRGTMTVDSYLGRIATHDVSLPPPPPDLAREFDTAITRAVSIARQTLAARPRDVQAEYELGAALGIRASYVATVDGGMLAGFRAAREAYDAHERVLEWAPARADAGLTVGTYRYLVSSLSMPLRWMAYAVGFGGGRERGITLIEGAAAFHGDNRGDAALALLLIYNREHRYDEALRLLTDLRDRYPRNRLFWLETGSTLLRAERPAEAERMLDAGMQMLAGDTRPRMFGEDALWNYRRGSARAALGHRTDARADLERAVAARGRPWVEGRAHLELGKLALLDSDRVAARAHLQAAARLGDSDRDGASAERARQMLEQDARTR